MSPEKLKKTALFSLVLVVGILVCWEIYLRNKGVDHSFDDNPALWSYHRDRVYDLQTTVFIGSSRIKFDLDVETFEKMTGQQAVQLSCVGSSPLPQLYDLADDPAFTGNLVIDVTEVLFFSDAPQNLERPTKNLAYYHDITPTQRAAFRINKTLESNFVFLDKDYFSFNAMLDQLQLKSRPGVFMFPNFPFQFGRSKFSRQDYMTEEFMADTNLQNQVRGVWAFLGKQRSKPPMSGTSLDSLLNTVKVATDKIISRGGKVLFVRTPSSGPFWMGEQKGYPREKYWDKLLAHTGLPGIHFKDYPETDHYMCPEFSHLSTADALDYTRHLIVQIDAVEGWDFPQLRQM